MWEIPVPESLLVLLRSVHSTNERDPSTRLWTFSRTRAWQLVKAVMTRAGIAHGPQACPKGLRHGFGLHAIRSGVPLHLVQRWLGHARMETTAIYLQANGRGRTRDRITHVETVVQPLIRLSAAEAVGCCQPA
jgi:integrase/recombinase XerD